MNKKEVNIVFETDNQSFSITTKKTEKEVFPSLEDAITAKEAEKFRQKVLVPALCYLTGFACEVAGGAGILIGTVSRRPIEQIILFPIGLTVATIGGRIIGKAWSDSREEKVKTIEKQLTLLNSHKKIIR